MYENTWIYTYRIIVVIVILEIIKSSRESAAIRSAELYIDALQTNIVNKNINESFSPNTCAITNKVTTCESEEIAVVTTSKQKQNSTSYAYMSLITQYANFTCSINTTKTISFTTVAYNDMMTWQGYFTCTKIK